jgi:CDP-diacylglycerol--glycerol-3-phosphate 3-phosphatidyltransferase
MAYDASALATPANGITIARLLAAPVLFVLVLDLGSTWLCALAWVVLSCSDGLDGWVARRQGVTRSGAFLDPLADKFLVLGAMVALTWAGKFWWLPVGLIAAREVAISVFRTRLARHGVSVPARRLAKFKTLAQVLAVGAALTPPLAAHVRWLALWLLWISVGLALLSGARYLADGKRLIASASADPTIGVADGAHRASSI